MNETTAAYRQMIADGHTLTAQDAQTLCDLLETAEDVIQERSGAHDDMMRIACELRAERDQLRAELDTARAALVEQIEARQVTEAEGGALQQANNEIDRLQAELSRLRSAPVAVEVPKITVDDLRWWTEESLLRPSLDGRSADAVVTDRINEWFCEMLPPSRILKDGERAVPADRVEVLERIATIVAIATGEGSSRARHWPELAHLVVQLEDMRALRSGDAEGRKG